jgi:hypothetical protein
MRTALAALLGGVVAASAFAAAVWNPPAWVAENTVELRTTDPGGEPHWFKVWHVMLDGQLYVRLGSRAAGRFDRNVSKPVMGVRIAGNTFERVRGVLAPEMTERVTAAMKDKYWTQADFIVRRMNHPYTMRLEPEPEG